MMTEKEINELSYDQIISLRILLNKRVDQIIQEEENIKLR